MQIFTRAEFNKFYAKISENPILSKCILIGGNRFLFHDV